MNIFTSTFMLIVLISPTICRRSGLVLYPEEMTDKVVINDGKGPAVVDKMVDEDDKLRIITDQAKDNAAEGRVIYPTEEAETGRAIAKDRAAMAKEKTKIPETLLIAMNNVNNVDDFLKQFVAPDPNDIIYNNNTESAFSESNRGGSGVLSRKGLSGGSSPRITEFAGCKPQKSVVKVENPDGGGVLFWPPCVYLPRCGGCCTSEMMTCRSTATSEVNVTVLQARYTGPQSNPFANEGVRIITLEQHDSCACGCKELPEDCTSLQEYRKGECRCVCANEIEAPQCQKRANKFWDSHDCVCKCRNISDCSSGFHFNVKTCRCEVLRLSLISRIGLSFTDRNKTTEAENGNPAK